MSRHLPSVSGRNLVRALQRTRFVVLRQKGRHVSLEKRTAGGIGGPLFRCTAKSDLELSATF
jgi:predicted RNA binding protein YcfA (HicA-like mRNA interferase family)